MVGPDCDGRSILEAMRDRTKHLPTLPKSLLQRLLSKLRTIRLCFVRYEEELEGYVFSTAEVEIVEEAEPHWRKVIGWAMELNAKKPEGENLPEHKHDTSELQMTGERKRAGRQRLQEYIRKRCEKLKPTMLNFLLFPKEIGWQKEPLAKEGPYKPTRFRHSYNQYWKVWYKGNMNRRLMQAMIQHWRGTHKDFIASQSAMEMFFPSYRWGRFS